jgi:c-di-AMP phosphodiesterase-like protein
VYLQQRQSFLNDSDIDPTLRRVMDEIDKKPELKERFVTSDEAWVMQSAKLR